MISADIDIFQIRSTLAGYGELDNGSWLWRIRWGDLGQSQTEKSFECWINNNTWQKKSSLKPTAANKLTEEIISRAFYIYIKSDKRL